MEIIQKLDENRITIQPEAIVPDVVVKELSELEADLKQAQDSLIYVMQRHAEEIAPIQKTIDLFQKRLDEAKNQGIIAKPKVINEFPIPFPKQEEIISEGIIE